MLVAPLGEQSQLDPHNAPEWCFSKLNRWLYLLRYALVKSQNYAAATLHRWCQGLYGTGQARICGSSSHLSSIYCSHERVSIQRDWSTHFVVPRCLVVPRPSIPHLRIQHVSPTVLQELTTSGIPTGIQSFQDMPERRAGQIMYTHFHMNVRHSCTLWTWMAGIHVKMRLPKTRI